MPADTEIDEVIVIDIDTKINIPKLSQAVKEADKALDPLREELKVKLKLSDKDTDKLIKQYLDMEKEINRRISPITKARFQEYNKAHEAQLAEEQKSTVEAKVKDGKEFDKRAKERVRVARSNATLELKIERDLQKAKRDAINKTFRDIDKREASRVSLNAQREAAITKDKVTQMGVVQTAIKRETKFINENTVAVNRNNKSKAQGSGTTNGKEGFYDTMLGGSGTSFGHKIATTAQYAAAGSAIYFVSGAFRDAASAALEFDDASFRVAAVLNVTTDSAKGLVKELEGIGTTLGGQFSEINQAAIDLGRAGLPFDDIKAGTDVVVRMSMLTGDSIADSTSAISSYRQVFADSGTTITEFGNQLAYAANESRLSTQDIGTLSNYALAAGKSIGFTSENVLGLSTAFSNFGLNASTIGTQIRKLAEMIKTESDAANTFYDTIGINQKQLLSDLQNGDDAALEGFITKITDMSQAQYNAAVADLPLLEKNVIDTLRKTGDASIEHMAKLYDKNSNQALKQADIMAMSYERMWDRMLNTALEASTSITTGALDSVFDRSKPEEFKKTLEGLQDALYTTASVIETIVIAGAAYLVISKAGTIATNINTTATAMNVVSQRSAIAALGGRTAATSVSTVGLMAQATATNIATASTTALNRVMGLNPWVATTTAMVAGYVLLDNAADNYLAKEQRRHDKLIEMQDKLVRKNKNNYDLQIELQKKSLAVAIEASGRAAGVAFNMGNEDAMNGALKQIDTLTAKLDKLNGIASDEQAFTWIVTNDDIQRLSSYNEYLRKQYEIGIDIRGTLKGAKDEVSGLYENYDKFIKTQLNKAPESIQNLVGGLEGDLANKIFDLQAATSAAEKIDAQFSAKKLKKGDEGYDKARAAQNEYNALQKVLREYQTLLDLKDQGLALDKQSTRILTDNVEIEQARAIDQKAILVTIKQAHAVSLASNNAFENRKKILDGSVSEVVKLSEIEAKQLVSQSALNGLYSQRSKDILAHKTMEDELGELEANRIITTEEYIKKQEEAVKLASSIKTLTGTIATEEGKAQKLLQDQWIADYNLRMLKMKTLEAERIKSYFKGDDVTEIWNDSYSKKDADKQARIIKLSFKNVEDGDEAAQRYLDAAQKTFEQFPVYLDIAMRDEDISALDAIGRYQDSFDTALSSARGITTEFDAWSESLFDAAEMASNLGNVLVSNAKSELESTNKLKSLKSQWEIDKAEFSVGTERYNLAEKQYLQQKAITEADNLNTQISGYAQLASAASGFYKDGSKESKVLMRIQTTLATIAGVTAILNAGATAGPAWAPAMAAAATAVAGILSLAGIAFSGSSGVVAPTEYETNIQEIEDNNKPMLDRLDRQIELLESIDGYSGTAVSTTLDRAKLKYETDYAVAIETGLSKGRDINYLKYTTEIWDSIKDSNDEYRTIADAFNAELSADVFVADEAVGATKSNNPGFIGMQEDILREETNYLETLQLLNKYDLLATFGYTDAEYKEIINELEQANSDYVLSIINSMDVITEAADNFKDAFDSITESTYYQDQALSKAQADVDTLLDPGQSVEELLVEYIDAVSQLDALFTPEQMEVLLSTEDDVGFDATAQRELYNEIASETSLVLEDGALEMLNYQDSLLLVSDALARSNENTTSWLDSLKTSDELLQDMANSLGVGVVSSLEELPALYAELATSGGLLTDAELEYLNASRDAIEATNELTESIMTLQEASDIVTSDIERQVEEYWDLAEAVDASMLAISTFTSSFTDAVYTFDEASALASGVTSVEGSEDALAYLEDYYQQEVDLIAEYYDSLEEGSSAYNTSKTAIDDFLAGLNKLPVSLKSINDSINNLTDVEDAVNILDDINEYYSGMEDAARNIVDTFESFVDDLRAEQLGLNSPEALRNIYNDSLSTLNTAIEDGTSLDGLGDDVLSSASTYLDSISETASVRDYQYEQARISSQLEDVVVDERTALDILDDSMTASVLELENVIEALDSSFLLSTESLAEAEANALIALQDSLGGIVTSLEESTAGLLDDSDVFFNRMIDIYTEAFGADSLLINWLVANSTGDSTTLGDTTTADNLTLATTTIDTALDSGLLDSTQAVLSDDNIATYDNLPTSTTPTLTDYSEALVAKEQANLQVDITTQENLIQSQAAIIQTLDKMVTVYGAYATDDMLAGLAGATAIQEDYYSTLAYLESQVVTGYASGGFTSPIGKTDSTGFKIAGVVHEDEWVAPKWLVDGNPRLFNALEDMRQRGYADGGFTSSASMVSVGPDNSDGSLIRELKGMRAELTDIKQLQVRQTATSNRQLDTQRASLDELIAQGGN